MRTLCSVFCALLVWNHGLCQILQFGGCPQVEPVKLFDVESFLGRWSVIERFPVWFEDGQCSSKRIEACGRRVEIEHVYVKQGIQFVLRVNSSYTPGDEAVFEIQNNGIDTIGVPIAVIATDYTQHALLYGCKYNTMSNIKYTVAWILSRNQTLPEDTTDELRMTLNAIPYTSSVFLERVRQDSAMCTHHWTAHVEESNDVDED